MLLGRLTRDPEVRYSQSATPVAVAKYGIAVRRQFSRQGEPDVDFFNIVAFGKAGEFAEKYFRKGQQVVVVGSLKVNNFTDKDGNKRTSTDVIVEEQHFAESKGASKQAENTQGAIPTTVEDDDDLPF